jgi:peptidoglycan-associated lipoprotein
MQIDARPPSQAGSRRKKILTKARQIARIAEKQIFLFGHPRSFVARNRTFAPRHYSLALFVVWTLSAGGCATSDSVSPKTFSPPASLTNPASAVAARSPSALEAISRGVAAVTPPGAALQDVFYQFDSVELQADAREVLKKNAEWMKANPKARVEVEGHCDDVGSAEYNLALGAKRAQVAKDFLVNEGITSDRLVTISYGKEAPACFEQNEECRVKNRRARFVMFTEVPTS